MICAVEPPWSKMGHEGSFYDMDARNPHRNGQESMGTSRREWLRARPRNRRNRRPVFAIPCHPSIRVALIEVYND